MRTIQQATKLAVLIFLLVFSLAPNAMGANFQEGIAVYNNGKFVDAFKIWTPLAQKGNTDAQFKLGVLYAKGQGVTKDYVKAYAWWNVAALQGNERAEEFREGLLEDMSTDQIDKGQELSKQLYENIFGSK